MKEELRRLFLKKRNELSQEGIQKAQKLLLQHFQAFPRQTQWLSFASILNEIPTKSHFHWARSRGDQVFFPKVVSETKMEFFEVEAWKQLTKSRYSLEPPPTKKWEARENTFVLVPGIVFSMDRHRIGFGKGYYDRFLSEHPSLPCIGLAYDFQIIKRTWEIDSFDQSLDAIFCPQAIWGTSRLW